MPRRRRRGQSLSTRLFKLARLVNTGRNMRKGPMELLRHKIRQWVLRKITSRTLKFLKGFGI